MSQFFIYTACIYYSFYKVHGAQLYVGIWLVSYLFTLNSLYLISPDHSDLVAELNFRQKKEPVSYGGLAHPHFFFYTFVLLWFPKIGICERCLELLKRKGD